LDFVSEILGLYLPELEPLHMATRAFVLFFAALILLRIAGLRTLGKQSSFDTLTTFMLAGVLGRAIIVQQSFIGSLLAALVLVLLHRFIAFICFRSKGIGRILKGENIILLKDGERSLKNLRRTHITDEDLIEAIRKEINDNSYKNVAEIHLERSGYISIIKKE
jgi:uncharacterized membrane protein YcaP (DUF421 family)